MIYDQPGEVLKTYQVKEPRSNYSLEQQHEVAATYLSTGSGQKTSQLTNVPESTIRTWAKSDWWVATLARLRAEYSEELEARISTALFKSLDQIDERLNNGDVTVTKLGDIVRHPIRARDLSIMASILFDKRQITRNQPTSITASDSRLQSLAAKLESLAPKLVGETVDNGTDPSPAPGAQT